MEKYEIILLVFLLLFIFVICIFYFYIYIRRYEDHKLELDKIKRIEEETILKEEELSALKTKTFPCETNYTDPRSCYIDSGYSCTWNEEINRCDQIL
jgi:hypothetical protein